MPDPTLHARTEQSAGEPVGVPAAVASDVTGTGQAMTPKARWALAITSIAVFMVTLDNLVVTTAIPVIRVDLHASLSGLQWTVNAYTLTFAVLLLTGGRPRRPVRAPAAAGGRYRNLHGGVGRGRAGALDHRARHRSCSPGRGRRDRHAVDADHPVRRGARGAARPRTRHLGRHQRSGRRP